MVYTGKIVGAEILIAHDSGGWFNPTLNFMESSDNFYLPNILVNENRIVLEDASQAEYFYDYLDGPKYLHCPESPSPFPELREAWEQGDDWRLNSWLMGTKCFWRNYKGITTDDLEEVWGPRSLSNNPRGGKCLVSCLVNYGRRGHNKLISGGQFIGACNEKFSSSNTFWPDFWAKDGIDLSGLAGAMDCVQIQAGYVDGHVESRKGSETMGVWVESDLTLDGWPPNLSRGKFYLPSGGLR